MKTVLQELKRRNALLYWFGWYNLVCGIVCIALIIFDSAQILGISRWIKPTKFFVSVWLMIWTLDWIMYYLQYRRSIKICSWLIVTAMFIENFIITLQAARDVTSHFNNTTLFNGILFAIMGMFITIFTLVMVWVTVMFLLQKSFTISATYLLGIRLGLILFVFFSSEGGLMVAHAAHTIGGADGGAGLPLLNWSTRYGDLRIPHFFGIHALQVLPLAGYYLTKTKMQIAIVALLYFAFVMALLLMALNGRPIISS